MSRRCSARATAGPTGTASLFYGPGGVRVEDIRMKVRLWQGDADVSVPLQMGEYYASTIPDCAATFYPNEGHFIFYSHAEEIFGALIS